MKTHPTSGKLRGFTLVELLVTITIIVILAGLSMGGFSYITRKQADEKTRIQISLLEKGLEEYKLDNGEYPPSGDSNILYQRLYWDGASESPPGKIYLAELDPENNKQGWTEGSGAGASIIDPYGNEYIYRRGDDPEARNPDFDILSKGKDGRTSTGNASSPDNKDDIKNF